MVNKKITELQKTTTPVDTDLLVLETTNGTRAVSYGDWAKTILDKKNNLPTALSIQDTDMLTIKNDTGKHSIKFGNLLNDLSEKIISQHNIIIIPKTDDDVSNWKYIINDNDNTITLDEYIGTHEDVIVRNSYKVSGKTYKTKLKNRPLSLFYYNDIVKNIIFDKNIETSNVTDISYMFQTCENLTSIDLSNFDISKVTDISYMFEKCPKLTSVKFPNIEASNVTDMSHMFGYCPKLTFVDLSNFDISKVTDISYMFQECSDLASVKFSNIKVSNVTKMNSMFQKCPKLTSVDLSNFDTSNVTSMSSMFYECSNLTSIDLSNFDTSKVTDMRYMFYNCTNLQKVLVTSGKWITSQAIIDGMFLYSGVSSVTYK